MKRITVADARHRGPSSGRDLAFYLPLVRCSGSRIEAEWRLLQAMDDRSLSDEDFHSVRLAFDGRVSFGWP